MAGDANYDDVSLLLPFDGADAATSATDESNDARTVSFGGGCELDTAQKKWGTASLYCDGGGSSTVTLTNGTTLLNTATPFTVQFWMRPTTVGASKYLTGSRAAFSGSNFALYQISANLQLGGDDLTTTVSTSAPLSANTWHYIEMNRQANGVWTVLVDGTLALQTTETGAVQSSGSTWFIGGHTPSGSINFTGWIDDYRITNGVARNTTNYSVPTAAHPTEGLPEGANVQLPSPIAPPQVLFNVIDPVAVRIALPSAIGAPAINVTVPFETRAQLPSPLAGAAVAALNDFTSLITDPTQYYVMRITGAPEVEIPISSWQATLQTDRQDYLQCVIPNVTAYTDTLSARQATEEFIVYRKAQTAAGDTVESEMARAPLTTININGGPFRQTATVSGYRPLAEPSTSTKVTALTGIRQTSQSLGGNARIRADIDWFLRPGQEVTADGLSITANYINYFYPSVGDAYMDVGNRG